MIILWMLIIYEVYVLEKVMEWEWLSNSPQSNIYLIDPWLLKDGPLERWIYDR